MYVFTLYIASDVYVNIYLSLMSEDLLISLDYLSRSTKFDVRPLITFQEYVSWYHW